MSFNALFGLGQHTADSLAAWYKMQDDAASTGVADSSGNNRVALSNVNTSTRTTTGPNSWLPKALTWNGTSDVVASDLTHVWTSAEGFTVGGFVKPNSVTGFQQYLCADVSTRIFQFRLNGSNHELVRFSGSTVYTATSSGGAVIGEWDFVYGRFDNSEGTVVGENLLSGEGSDSNTSAQNTTARKLEIGYRQGGVDFFSGAMAGMFVFTRALSDDELLEIPGGPEPLRADVVVTGARTVGSVLTCNPGSWDSQDNGTIVYSYQWRRNGIDIDGETSSTYTLTDSDVGCDITCWVRGTNDGGYDITQDSVSNTVVPSSSGNYWTITNIADNLIIGASEITARGPYYPCVVDMREFSSFPYDWALYVSTDHDVGGIYLWVADGDPGDPSNWLSYDDALSAGGFDSIASKPAANPIYNDTTEGTPGATQCETPWVVIDGSTCWLTYHNHGAGNTQSTQVAESSDGLNFTRKIVTGSSNVIVDYDPQEFVGNGHTGYLAWSDSSRIPGIKEKWFGYSRHGGGTWSTFQRVTSARVDTRWSNADILGFAGGRLVPDVGWMRWDFCDPRYFRLDARGRLVGLFSFGDFGEPDQPETQVAGSMCEIILSDDGSEVLSYPREILTANPGTNGIEEFTLCEYSDHYYVFYTLRGASSNEIRVHRLDWNPKAESPAPYSQRYDTEYMGPGSINEHHDATLLSSLPDGWRSRGTDGGSVATVTSNRFTLTPSGTSQQVHLEAVDTITPANYEVIDVFLEGYRRSAIAIPGIMLADATPSASLGGSGSHTGVCLFTAGSKSGWATLRTMNLGVLQDVTLTNIHDMGWDDDEAISLRGIGLRWYPRQSRLVLLTDNYIERHEIDITGSRIDTSIPVRPIVFAGNFSVSASAIYYSACTQPRPKPLITRIASPSLQSVSVTGSRKIPAFSGEGDIDVATSSAIQSTTRDGVRRSGEFA